MSVAADKIRKAREFSIEVAPGKRITLLRPRETDAAQFRSGIDALLSSSCKFVVGWDLLESDVMPRGVGSSDPLPCDPDTVAEVLGDNSEWLAKVWNALIESANERAKQKADAAKN